MIDDGGEDPESVECLGAKVGEGGVETYAESIAYAVAVSLTGTATGRFDERGGVRGRSCADPEVATEGCADGVYCTVAAEECADAVYCTVAAGGECADDVCCTVAAEERADGADCTVTTLSAGIAANREDV